MFFEATPSGPTALSALTFYATHENLALRLKTLDNGGANLNLSSETL